VAFTDSDCVAEQNWLKNGIARMIEGVGLVQGKTLPDSNQPKRTLQQTMKVLSEDGYYQTCNIFYRKKSLEDASGFSSEFCGLNWFGKPRWGGEDTDLAWKVKKSGWRSVFADDALVFHHVFQVTSLKAFLRSMHLNSIFVIARNIKKHPEMRKAKLYRKIFKSKQRALFYIFILSLLVGVYIHWGFFLFGFLYVAKLVKVSFYGRPIRSFHRGLALFGIVIVVELVESILSLCASLGNRTVIL
jgi:cellulose synthase/poly-beta-1,6-N-acetylglucosamine synthase-like glycosyltransferase